MELRTTVFLLVWLTWLALQAGAARTLHPDIRPTAVARLLSHSRALQQSIQPGTFQPASDGPGYSDLYTLTSNTDIDNNNLLYSGNPFQVKPDAQCYSEGVIVSSADECLDFCTLMTDIAVQTPSSGVDQGAQPCLGVAYVSSHPAGTTLPPIGCCFPKGSRTTQQPSGQKPGVDSYTAIAQRLTNTDMPGVDILEPGLDFIFEASFVGRSTINDPLYPRGDGPVVEPDTCFGLGAVSTYASGCFTWCTYWNENLLYRGASKCVGVTYVSSQPAEALGCCFLKNSTSTKGVGGSKVGVDSYVFF